MDGGTKGAPMGIYGKLNEASRKLFPYHQQVKPLYTMHGLRRGESISSPDSTQVLQVAVYRKEHRKT